jgi:hypothetical protein
LYTELERKRRKNNGRKNAKENNEIPAKVIQIHWSPQEKLDINVGPEQA